MVRLLSAATSLLCAAAAYAISSTGSSVLVILEPALKRDDYSIFFKSLEDNGYELTFRSPKDVSPKLVDHDVPQFAHVILFAPTTKTFAADITPQSLVSLIGQKTNLLVAISETATPLSTLALEFGLSPPPPGTPLISHFPPRDTPHTVIPISPLSGQDLSPVLRADTPVLFAGVPFALSTNPMLVPILRAPAEAFAADTDTDSGADAVVDASDKAGEGLWAGTSLGTVVGFQSRGGARVTWAGGVKVFSDEFTKLEVAPGQASGNKAFARDVAAWTFQESGVLRIDNTTHYKVGEASPPETYTTNDEAVFEARISRWDPISAKWIPFRSLNDVQLEFTMLDPHIRTALSPVIGTPGLYRVQFRVPDRHGVFKFVVDYRRAGFSHLASSTTVPVVPPRHDGYPRFLSAAWPYYAGAISTSAAFVLFCALWLGGDVREARKGKAKAEWAN